MRYLLPSLPLKTRSAWAAPTAAKNQRQAAVARQAHGKKNFRLLIADSLTASAKHRAASRLAAVRRKHVSGDAVYFLTWPSQRMVTLRVKEAPARCPSTTMRKLPLPLALPNSPSQSVTPFAPSRKSAS